MKIANPYFFWVGATIAFTGGMTCAIAMTASGSGVENDVAVVAALGAVSALVGAILMAISTAPSN